MTKSGCIRLTWMRHYVQFLLFGLDLKAVPLNLAANDSIMWKYTKLQSLHLLTQILQLIWAVAMIMSPMIQEAPLIIEGPIYIFLVWLVDQSGIWMARVVKLWHLFSLQADTGNNGDRMLFYHRLSIKNIECYQAGEDLPSLKPRLGGGMTLHMLWLYIVILWKKCGILATLIYAFTCFGKFLSLPLLSRIVLVW